MNKYSRLPVSATVLRQPESTPESRPPSDVQRLPRPPALGRASELAYLRPGDRTSVSIRTDDCAIDLGEQTTAITAP